MKTLHIMACCLFLAAIVADFGGKSYYSTAATTLAKAVAAGRTDDATARVEANAALSTGNRLTSLGMVIATIGLAVWLTSIILGRRQGRRMSPVVPLVMFAAYVLLFLLMV
jgi:hypothetical protein